MTIKHDNLEYLDQYSRHLKKLDSEDRYTRFGYSVSNETIDRFILDILYNRDSHNIFVYLLNDIVVGFGHLASNGKEWELAVSVEKKYQGQGIATQLMAYMIDWGKVHNVTSVYMHCISNNYKIQHLAKKYGLRTVERDGAQITAQVKLPEPTLFDYASNFIGEQTQLATDIVHLQRTWLRNWTGVKYQKTQ